MLNPEDFKIFQKARVAKLFPGFGDEPFPGVVSKVDTKGSDDKPFKITYEDGDREWVTLDELLTILVDKQLVETAKSRKTPSSSRQENRKRKSQEAEEAAEAAPKSTGKTTGKKQKQTTPGQAAAAKGSSRRGKQQHKQEEEKAEEQQQQQQQEEVGQGQQAEQERQQPSAAPAAAASAGTANGAGPSKAAAKRLAGPPAKGVKGTDAAEASEETPASVDRLVTEVIEGAPAAATKMSESAVIMRLPYVGAAAAALPAMAQAVVCGGHSFFTVYGNNRARSSLAPGAAPEQPDYQAETQTVLAQLDKLLTESSAHKRHLLKVCVYLRSMTDGLPGFTEAWNKWIDRSSVPVITVLESAGPFSSAGVVLEATAYSGR